MTSLYIVYGSLFLLFLLISLSRGESDKIKTGGEGYGRGMFLFRGVFCFVSWLSIVLILESFKEIIGG